MSDLELQKAHVKVTYPVLISALVSVILGVFLLAGSYFSVLAEIRAGRKESLKIQQFQGWLDEFRVRNESVPVKVPAIPKAEEFSAIYSDPRIAALKTTH